MNNFDEILNRLSDKSKIVFGPLGGEFGWELAVVSCFIKQYKYDNPNKEIIVITRENRKCLYENSGIDKIITFNIPDDYGKYSPRTNSLFKVQNKRYNVKSQLDLSKFIPSINTTLTKEYKKYHREDFSDVHFNKEFNYDLTKYLVDFPVNKQSSDIINSLKQSYSDNIICIFPRHRFDITHRNWTKEGWNKIFDHLGNLATFTILICGAGNSYIKPDNEYSNMFVLEEISELNSVDNLSLMIEAVRNSSFTFGIQSSGILLSNLLKIPNIYIGMEEKLTSHAFNPYDTKYNIIVPKKVTVTMEYDISTEKVITEFNNFMKLIVNKEFDKIKNNFNDEYMVYKDTTLQNIQNNEDRVKYIRNFNFGNNKELIYTKIKKYNKD